MPEWLHRIIYRYKPYRYGRDDERKKGKEGTEGIQGRVNDDNNNNQQMKGGEGNEGDDEYYHSHQKKLAKMEMDQAFEVRGIVMIVLVAVMTAFGWGTWKGLVWVVGVIRGVLLG